MKIDYKLPDMYRERENNSKQIVFQKINIVFAKLKGNFIMKGVIKNLFEIFLKFCKLNEILENTISNIIIFLEQATEIAISHRYSKYLWF